MQIGQLKSDLPGQIYRLRWFKGIGGTRGDEVFKVPWRKGVPGQPRFKGDPVCLIYRRHSEIGPYALYGFRGAIEVKKQLLPKIKVLREALRNERPYASTD